MTNEINTEAITPVEQKESIELIRTAFAKGFSYGWKIKIFAGKNNELDIQDFDRLNRADAYLQGKWGETAQ